MSFSIFFVIMLDSAKNLVPFKPSTAYKEPKVFWRLLVAIITLNIIPVIHFTYFLFNLQKIPVDENWMWFDLPVGYIAPVLEVFALSLSVYGFVRLYNFVVALSPNAFYTQLEIERIDNTDHHVHFKRDWSQQLFVFVFYFIIPIIGFYLIKDWKFGIWLFIPLGICIVSAWIVRKRRMIHIQDL